MSAEELKAAGMNTVEVVELRLESCPEWATGTILLKGEQGQLVGYARLRRVGDTAAEVTSSSSPSGLRLLAQPLPEEGA